MNLQLLERNIDYAITEMRSQAGREPGGPTGLCHPFVLTALTGSQVDYNRVIEENTDVTTCDIENRREHRAGLKSDPVIFIRQIDVFEALRPLLQQTKVPTDAVLISGQVIGREEQHIVAAVIDDIEYPSIYHIVDSLLPNGILKNQNLDDVINFTRTRFVPYRLSYRHVPNELEKQRRSAGRRTTNVHPVLVSNEVVIQTPSIISDILEIVIPAKSN